MLNSILQNRPVHYKLLLSETDAPLQRSLALFNRHRLNPSLPNAHWQAEVEHAREMLLVEGKFIERERAAIGPLIGGVPRDPEAFMAWFESLIEKGPGQNDPLFPWLASHADHAQMKWFLAQEVAGEAGFEDLVALTQIKIPTRAKLEMARNYWDEMGRGTETGMHGPMLAALADEFGLEDFPAEEVVVEALSLSNLLVGFAANRRYAYHSVGALGAIELTAPGRARSVLAGLERLGFHRAAQYYRLHSTLDVKHSREWNREVIRPLIEESPESLPYIAEGAWLRLELGARCFDRYRDHFRINVPFARPLSH